MYVTTSTAHNDVHCPPWHSLHLQLSLVDYWGLGFHGSFSTVGRVLFFQWAGLWSSYCAPFVLCSLSVFICQFLCKVFFVLPLFDWTAFLLKLSWVMHFNKVCSLLHVLTVDSRRQFYFVPLHCVAGTSRFLVFLSPPSPLSLSLTFVPLFFSQTRWLLLVYVHMHDCNGYACLY